MITTGTAADLLPEVKLPRIIDHLLRKWPIIFDDFGDDPTKLAKPGLVLAGGLIRDAVMMHEAVSSGSNIAERGNDADLFVIANSEEEARTFAERIAGGIGNVSDNGWNIPIEDPAIEHSDGQGKIQILWRWSRSKPEALIDSFDFVACKAAIYYTWERGATLSACVHKQFRSEAGEMKLTFKPGPDRRDTAASSLVRALRFMTRGWTMTPEAMLGLIAARTAELEDQAKRAAVARGEIIEDDLGSVKISEVSVDGEEAFSDFEASMPVDTNAGGSYTDPDSPLSWPLEADELIARFFVREDGSLVVDGKS